MSSNSSTTPHRQTGSLSGNNEIHRDQVTRRASIRSALDWIQRFKQSWISIVILKGGIGLGQVIVLITLLNLSSSLPSPLYPARKQSEPTQACPHPEYFQAWMGVQIGRLTICWAVSMWICFERRRHRGDQRASNDEEEDTVSSEISHRVHTVNHITPSASSSSSSSSIFHTPSTQSSRTPETIYISTYTSMPSFTSLSPDRQNGGRKESRLTPHIVREVREHRENDGSVPSAEGGNARDEDDAERTDRESLMAARQMVRPDHAIEDGQNGMGSSWREATDRIAPKISKFLGLLSFVLFILGNILLFSPSPSNQESCYRSSPMLWWGVMTVTGVGWFLLAQIVIVILVAGIGGTLVVAILRNFGISSPSSPPPGHDRAPPPIPLTAVELSSLKFNCYAPHPENPNLSIREELLPHPPIFLEENRITCAICQENFVPPEIGREEMSEWLRELSCNHVYHAKCIDEWLTRGSANCPFCNRSVREMINTSSNDQADHGREHGQRRKSVLSTWLRKESR
ncbi:uncharacterized protein IL334_007196 [Kwoniella shivajii]|uniref:RING-type domain-containing protein n=1 Tax=Kwoniella shivajii TaxID=564305 RepID=A0ABZ1D9C8_9TREE|nr:hypothetical protein IL334_007196 [Kwoniella shivajii]